MAVTDPAADQAPPPDPPTPPSGGASSPGGTPGPDDSPPPGPEGPVQVALEVVDTVTTPAATPASRALDGLVEGFDRAVDARFDRFLRGRPTVDRFMYSLSELADFSLLWHLLGATRGLRSERDAAAALRLSVALGVESAVVNGGLKSLFRRERPVPTFDRPHHLRIPVTTSFPSGHASAAMCAATLLADGRSRRAQAGWYALGALVAASRVHVKIHHASDVVGGMAVGLAVGRVARRLRRQR